MTTFNSESLKQSSTKIRKNTSRKTLKENFRWGSLDTVLMAIRSKNFMETTISTIWFKHSNRVIYLASQNTHSQRLLSATARTSPLKLKTKWYTTPEERPKAFLKLRTRQRPILMFQRAQTFTPRKPLTLKLQGAHELILWWSISTMVSQGLNSLQCKPTVIKEWPTLFRFTSHK